MVEDDEIIARSIREHLQAWNYDVCCVEDFSNVVAEFVRFDPQLVLMDITLPFFNGYHWCSEIRKISKVPVIFLSSAADNMNIVMAVNMGADDFIPKPFDLEVLTVKIQAMLRRRYDFAGTGSMLEHKGAILNLNETTLTYQEQKIEPVEKKIRSLGIGRIYTYKERNRVSSGMKLWSSYLKRNLGWIAVILLTIFSMSVIVELNGVHISEWIYGTILCIFFLLVIGGVDFYLYYRRHRNLQKMQEIVKISVNALDMPKDQIEEDYQKLLQIVHEDKVKAVNDLESGKKDMAEYYTMWVHQIKTPIAAMRLLLQSEDTPKSRECAEELFHIEQYVEMALHYSRLDSDTTDFVIRKTSLDEIVREAVRKYAKLFIRKKIRLDYQPLNIEVLTDEKWLEFVIEQILSNAVKYTPKGTVSIYMENEDTLIIEDTGIGIRAEDLPRVCERGYTGYNGHSDKRSTGIGLYLCRRVLEQMSHSIEIESEMGKGTRVKIGLITKERIHE